MFDKMKIATHWGRPGRQLVSSLVLFMLLLTTAQQSAVAITLDRLSADDPSHNHFYFGYSTALTSDYAIIGSPGGIQSNKDATNFGGSFHIIDTSNGQVLLTVDDPAPPGGFNGNEFGTTVATNGDIAVTGNFWGDTSAMVYDVDPLSGTFGSILTTLTPSGDPIIGLEQAVVQGDRALVGFRGSGFGGASIFDVDPASPTFGDELFQLSTSSAGAINRAFGDHVAWDGDTALVSATFDNSEPDAPLPPPLPLTAAESNSSVSSTGAVYVYDTTTGSEIARLVASDGATTDQFGSSVSLANGLALVGAEFHAGGGVHRSGAAYLFDVDPLSPSFGDELIELVAPDGAIEDFFGHNVLLVGTTAIVQAPEDEHASGSTGSLYFFDVDPLSPSFGDQIAFLAAPAGGNFRGQLSADGDTILVGAALEESLRGAAYMFSLNEALNSSVPEPSSLALATIAMLGLGCLYCRRSARRAVGL